MPVVPTILLVVLALVVLPLALIGAQYLTRGTPVQRVGSFGAKEPATPGDAMFARTLSLHTRTALAEGHRVELMINGDQTYERLWEDLRAARRSLTVQMYYYEPGRMADTIGEILIARARAGVRVLLLHDAFGSSGMPETYMKELKAAGVRVATFRPVKWYELHKAQQRSHIRVVVIDGAVAYTGGFGIDDKWYGDGRRKDQWRDTNVRFEGPAIAQLQATFAAGWAEATGDLITGETFFPVPEAGDGTVCAGLMHAAPTMGSTVAERFLALSIAGAARSLFITNSYFVPDDDFCRLLTDAAERGVDVRVLTTGRETDVRTTWHAGRARYEQLLERGVRIFEYRPTMMHAKTIVVDDLWCGVGTLNFDNRSLAFNDETVLLINDAGIGARLRRIFEEDLAYSDEIQLESFRRRGLRDRVLERLATSMSRLL